MHSVRNCRAATRVAAKLLHSFMKQIITSAAAFACMQWSTEACLGAAFGDGLDAVDAVEASEQGGWVLHTVAVVGGNELEQQQHLLMRHCLDHEAIVSR